MQQSEPVFHFLITCRFIQEMIAYIVSDNHCFECVAFASLCIAPVPLFSKHSKRRHMWKSIPSIPSVSATVFCNNYQNLGKTDMGVKEVWTID